MSRGELFHSEWNGHPWWFSSYDCTPNTAGPGSIPGQKARHMWQLRVCMSQLKTPQAAAETEDPTCQDKDPAQPNK